MQIVIEISQQEYDGLKAKNNLNALFLDYYEKKIVDGIVLPSGHGRLIDADSIDLQRELFGYLRYTGIDEFPYEDATKAIFEATTLVPPHKEVIKRG